MYKLCNYIYLGLDQGVQERGIALILGSTEGATKGLNLCPQPT